MTKHRTITGFVAVALLAVAATTATMRSHSPLADGTTGLTVDANKLADFEDRWSAMIALPPTTDTAQRDVR
jgi:predicted anti-sigma-YlaC factor YlaD